MLHTPWTTPNITQIHTHPIYKRSKIFLVFFFFTVFTFLHTYSSAWYRKLPIRGVLVPPPSHHDIRIKRIRDVRSVRKKNQIEISKNFPVFFFFCVSSKLMGFASASQVRASRMNQVIFGCATATDVIVVVVILSHTHTRAYKRCLTLVARHTHKLLVKRWIKNETAKTFPICGWQCVATPEKKLLTHPHTAQHTAQKVQKKRKHIFWFTFESKPNVHRILMQVDCEPLLDLSEFFIRCDEAVIFWLTRINQSLARFTLTDNFCFRCAALTCCCSCAD